MVFSKSAGEDHPRECGEHEKHGTDTSQRRGSSPRMRGALWIKTGEFLSKGIIPADAGSTTFNALQVSAFRDHPRGCGEHTVRPRRTSHVAGSSPRMRGAPINKFAKTVTDRIIPADAGSTRLEQLRGMLGADHPRGCGEHYWRICSICACSGSSPRMRGALFHRF